MKLLIVAALTLLSTNAFAIATCTGTVVPLAMQMALASGQGGVHRLQFLDVAADYSEIHVTLGNQDFSRVAKFKMTMGEDYQRVRKCVVSKVEVM